MRRLLDVAPWAPIGEYLELGPSSTHLPSACMLYAVQLGFSRKLLRQVPAALEAHVMCAVCPS